MRNYLEVPQAPPKPLREPECSFDARTGKFFIYVSLYVSTLPLVLLGGGGGVGRGNRQRQLHRQLQSTPVWIRVESMPTDPPHPPSHPDQFGPPSCTGPIRQSGLQNDINAKRSLKIPRFRDVTTSANRYNHMRSARCVASICIEGVQTCISKSVNVAVFCVSAVLQSHILASVDSPLSSRVWLRCDSPAP